jgi:hypothetical protein
VVNELRDLLHDNVATPPHEHGDLSAVLKGGRRRVRRRRMAAVGGTALAGAAVVGLTSLVWPAPPDLDAADVPAPQAPTLRLADASPAVRGEDYRVLASYTNENLNRDNGQYFDGVTDDGLILFRDGPQMDQPRPRYALMDPGTGKKDWLPEFPGADDSQFHPIDLGTGRLVFAGTRFGSLDDAGTADGAERFALVYDRDAREWNEVTWAGLPGTGDETGAILGPDDRVYVRVPATRGEPPEGGWPTGPGGEADDADADGDTYALWSVALDDGSDVRDEGLTVGDVAFTRTSMVWTDRTNGDSGLVHVRDLDTGEERAFDPRSGERCNLLSFGAAGDRIMMSQYCGTYDGGVRDDRVQVLGTDGEQVVTVQDDSVEGTLGQGSDVVRVTSYQRGRVGTFVYDLDTDRFLRVSEDVSSWLVGGPTLDGQFMWSTPENGRDGATQWIGEIAD